MNKNKKKVTGARYDESENVLVIEFGRGELTLLGATVENFGFEVAGYCRDGKKIWASFSGENIKFVPLEDRQVQKERK